jgi:hypothetical protein
MTGLRAARAFAPTGDAPGLYISFASGCPHGEQAVGVRCRVIRHVDDRMWGCSGVVLTIRPRVTVALDGAWQPIVRRRRDSAHGHQTRARPPRQRVASLLAGPRPTRVGLFQPTERPGSRWSRTSDRLIGAWRLTRRLIVQAWRAARGRLASVRDAARRPDGWLARSRGRMIDCWRLTCALIGRGWCAARARLASVREGAQRPDGWWARTRDRVSESWRLTRRTVERVWRTARTHLESERNRAERHAALVARYRADAIDAEAFKQRRHPIDADSTSGSDR